MVRHRRRGDADPRGRRPRHRPSGPMTVEIQKAYLDTVHGRERPVGAVARVRAGCARRRSVKQATKARSRSRARTSTSATRSSCSRCCARAGSRSGRRSTASRRRSRERSARRYAAAVSSGTAGLHLALRLGGHRAGRRGDHVAVLVRRVGELLHLRGRVAGLRGHRPAHAQPRPRGGRGRDDRAHEGDRRRRHLRLPVRARPAARDLRSGTGSR